jgi:hypothetical protein
MDITELPCSVVLSFRTEVKLREWQREWRREHVQRAMVTSHVRSELTSHVRSESTDGLQ